MISGKTRLAGLIGGNTTQSLSPQIHNFLAKQLGHDSVYVAFCVMPDQLKDAISGAYALGIRGLNVTAPYKNTAMLQASAIDASAQKVSAANLLKYEPKGYVAYNTDVYGILKSLDHHGITKVKTAAIYGAGGAAKAAVAALATVGCERLTIANRTASNAATLASFALENYGIKANASNMINEGDIFIQASSASSSELLELCPKNFAAVFDMNYAEPNPWLAQFKNGFDGLSMLIFQAVRAYEIIWDVNVSDCIVKDLLNKIKI